MTTIIQGIENSINFITDLALHVIDWNNTIESVQDRTDCYVERLEQIDTMLHILGLSDQISNRSKVRLESMVHKAIATVQGASYDKLNKLSKTE